VWDALKAGYQQRREIMHPARRILDHDLSLFVRSGEHKIGVIDLILSPISHANNERLEGRRMQ
jgi:hypothetical protein